MAHCLGISQANVDSVLADLSIPTIRFPGNPKRYFLLYALESCLFDLGLPVAMKGVAEAHKELAGVMYGTLTKEILRQRVTDLARLLGDNRRRGGPKISGRERKRVSRDKTH